MLLLLKLRLSAILSVCLHVGCRYCAMVEGANEQTSIKDGLDSLEKVEHLLKSLYDIHDFYFTANKKEKQVRMEGWIGR